MTSDDEFNALVLTLTSTPSRSADSGPTASDALGVVRALSTSPDALVDMLRTLTAPDLFRLVGRLAQITTFVIDTSGIDLEALAAKVRAFEGADR